MMPERRVRARLAHLALAFMGCGSSSTGPLPPAGAGAGPGPDKAKAPVEAAPLHSADVIGVEASGDEGGLFFAVTVKSDETGCDRYADWWEIDRPGGDLLYRRILAHSHPDDQPFTRGGGPVPVQTSDELVIRAHMAPGGYNGAVMRGSVAGGFARDPSIDAAWHPELAGMAPLPEGCAF